MRDLPKGIVNRGNSIRARISVGAKQISKDFNFKNYTSKEAALEDAESWLEENRVLACTLATGKTSKYKTKFAGELTQELLKEYLLYCQVTGIFTWKKSEAVAVKEGAITGCKDSKGYIIITLHGKPYKAHRLAFLYMEGRLPDKAYFIDHIDGNPANNSWSNLRLATRSENASNTAKTNSNTGVKGIHKLAGTDKYRASVMLNSRAISRTFNSLEEASIWVKEVRELVHGEFTNHG
jgi:hypothetical protein